MMRYFGTTLDDHGHYLWDLTGGFCNRSLDLQSLPFDPEKHRMHQKGHVEFEKVGGYTVLYITGSPKDTRLGCCSVFFLNGDYTKGQFIEEMKSNATAMQIIKAMPLQIDIKNKEQISERPA